MDNFLRVVCRENCGAAVYFFIDSARRDEARLDFFCGEWGSRSVAIDLRWRERPGVGEGVSFPFPWSKFLGLVKQTRDFSLEFGPHTAERRRVYSTVQSLYCTCCRAGVRNGTGEVRLRFFFFWEAGKKKLTSSRLAALLKAARAVHRGWAAAATAAVSGASGSVRRRRRRAALFPEASPPLAAESSGVAIACRHENGPHRQRNASPSTVSLVDARAGCDLDFYTGRRSADYFSDLVLFLKRRHRL